MKGLDKALYEALTANDELMAQGKVDSALALGDKIINVYPEYWQTYLLIFHQLRCKALWLT